MVFWNVAKKSHLPWSMSKRRLRLRRITIVIGEPIHFTAADLEPRSKEIYAQLTERVMAAIAARFQSAIIQVQKVIPLSHYSKR